MRQALRILSATLLAAFLAAMPLAHGLGARDASAQTPKFGGTMVFGAGGDAVKLDPAVITDGESALRTEQIFESLLNFDGPTTNIIPALATSWEVSSDGKSWTFNLRQGVKFHDGTPFNADAVYQNFERWRDEANPLHAGGSFDYWGDLGLSDVVVDEQAVSDSVFRVNLKEAQAPFLTNIALFPFAISSPTAMKADINNYFKSPVGTGPFKLTEWRQGDATILDANPDYWGGKPYLDRLVIRKIPDNSARFLELKAGTIQGMESVNVDDLPAVRADPNLKLVLRPSMNIAYINFNETVKPFDDARVRKAFAYAIDRQTIVDTLYGGIGVVANQFLPPSIWGYNPDIKEIPYDPSMAKQLLADAGYPNGLDTDFWYMPVSRPYYPSPQPIAEAFASDLGNSGIRVKLQTEDWGAYLSDARGQKFPVWMLGWTGDNGDPDNFLYVFYGKYSKDNTWDNAQVRDILTRAQKEATQSVREQLYKQAATIIYDQMPRIPVAHTTPPLAFQSFVEGYVANPTGTEFFTRVWLNK